MIGTTLTREPSAAPRPAVARAVASLPVLIEVPTLPGTRTSARRRAVGARPRRRLRREVRWIGSATIVGTVAVAGVLALRPPRPAPAQATPPAGVSALADPFAIELDHPIPAPPEAIVDRAVSRIEALPVAFPGYLLPGDDEGDVEGQQDGPDPGDEESGHARP